MEDTQQSTKKKLFVQIDHISFSTTVANKDRRQNMEEPVFSSAFLRRSNVCKKREEILHVQLGPSARVRIGDGLK